MNVFTLTEIRSQSLHLQACTHTETNTHTEPFCWCYCKSTKAAILTCTEQAGRVACAVSCTRQDQFREQLKGDFIPFIMCHTPASPMGLLGSPPAILQAQNTLPALGQDPASQRTSVYRPSQLPNSREHALWYVHHTQQPAQGTYNSLGMVVDAFQQKRVQIQDKRI